MNCNIKLIAGFIVALLVSNIFAQEPELLRDKTGSFKVIPWSVYGMSGSNFTKKETEANYNKLVSLTDLIRQNSVIKEMKGFNCNARLYGMQYDTRNGYGIPCDMNIEFCYFFMNNHGKAVSVDIEPPHWDIKINKLNTFTGFGYTTSKPSEEPKPGFNYAEWEKAATKLRDLFFMPGKKETLERGIDRYDGYTIIMYNPNNPPYWVPVTVREVYTPLLAYWKNHPDKIQSDMAIKMLEEEYALFSESEKDQFAYWGGRGTFASIDIEISNKPVMRINNEYWNKKLPRSAIQIISFNCPSEKKFIINEKEEQMKNNDGSYHINRFLETFDINTLLPAIEN